jgi:hypothetical protein
VLRGATQLQLGALAPYLRPVDTHARDDCHAVETQYYQRAFNTAPARITPCPTKCHKAIASFLAIATTPTLRLLVPFSAKRARYHEASSLAGWWRIHAQAISTSCVLAGLFPALLMP